MFFSSLPLIGSGWGRRRHMQHASRCRWHWKCWRCIEPRSFLNFTHMRTAKCNLNEKDSRSRFGFRSRLAVATKRPNTESAHDAEWIWRKPSILLFMRLRWRCRFQWFTSRREREKNDRQLSVGRACHEKISTECTHSRTHKSNAIFINSCADYWPTLTLIYLCAVFFLSFFFSIVVLDFMTS